MFLSRMCLDITVAQTKKFIHFQSYAQQLVHSLFASAIDSFLWRIDFLNGRLWLVILSPLRPDYQKLHEKIGFQGVFPSWDIMDYSDILDNIQLHTDYSFEVCVSPLPPSVVRHSDFQHISDIHNWFMKSGETYGFEVESFTSIVSNWHVINGQYILFAKIHGVLQPTDETLFHQSLTSGIGYVKTLGAGLMTVRDQYSVWQ